MKPSLLLSYRQLEKMYRIQTVCMLPWTRGKPGGKEGLQSKTSGRTSATRGDGDRDRWVNGWIDGGRDTYCCRACRSRRAGADRERSEAPSSFTLLLSHTLLPSYVLRSLISLLSVQNLFPILDFLKKQNTFVSQGKAQKSMRRKRK